MRVWVLAVAAIGCGRVAFEPIANTRDDAALGDGGASGMITRVQVLTPAFASAPTLNVPITVSAENLVIVAAYWNDASSSIAVTSARVASGGAWSALGSQNIASGCSPPANGANAQLFYGVADTSGTDTIQIQQSNGSAPLGAFVVEYAGTSGLEGASGMVAPSASNAMRSGPVTLQNDGVLVAVFHDSLDTGMMVPGSGFTELAIDSGAYALVEHAMVGSGTHEATATLPSGKSDRCWAAAAAAFAAR